MNGYQENEAGIQKYVNFECFGQVQLIEGINITTFWGLTSNIKQQSNKWMTICD